MATLSEVVKGIQSTNELLTENVKGQNRTAAMITAFVTGQQASFGDRLEAGREKGKSTKATAQPVRGSSGGGFKSGFMKGSGLGSLLGIGSKIIGAIFAGAAGAALLSTIAGVITGKIILGAAAIGLIRAFGVGAIDKVFEMLDPKNIFFTEKQQASITASFMTNLQIGMLAFLVNKQFGAAVFLGLMLKDLAMSMLGEEGRKKMKKKIFDTEFENKFFQKFVDNFTGENLAAVGGVIASFFGISAITKGLMWAFTGKMMSAGGAAGAGGAVVGRNAKGQFTKLRPGLKAGFLRGFGLRLGLAMMMPMVGEAIGNQISALTGKEDLGTVAQKFITPVLIGLMLAGPYGALVAAIATLSIMAFNKMQEWVFSQQEDQLNRLAKEREIAKKALELDPNNTVLARNLEIADIAYAGDLQRTSQLGRRGDALMNAQRIKDKEKLTGLSLSNKDFYSERAGTFYTGIGDNDLSPYNVGTLKFRKFAEAAQKDLRRRMRNEHLGTFKQMKSQDPTAGQFGLLKTLQLFVEDNTKAETNRLFRAMADQLTQVKLALGNGQTMAAPTTVVQVAGNQKVSTVDTLMAMRGHAGYGVMGLQTTTAMGGFSSP
jgi:hypothetical protein